MLRAMRTTLVSAFAVFSVLGLACAGFGAVDSPGPGDPSVHTTGLSGDLPDPVTDQLIVAVLPFSNNSGDPSWDPVGKGLADMMTTDLSKGDNLQVVERERLNEIVTEIGLQQTSMVDPTTAQKVGRLLGASHLVFGGLVAFAPDVRLDVRIVGVTDGKVLAAEEVTGKKEQFFDLEKALADKLVASLPGAEAPDLDKQVDDLEDVAEYGRALEEADSGDLEAATRRLGGLVREKPQFSLAQDRYQDILKAMMEARKRREGLLDDREKELLKLTQDWIDAHDPASSKGDTITFGAYVARYKLFTKNMIDTTDEGFALTRNVPSAKRETFLQAVEALTAESDRLIGALRARRKAGKPAPDFPKLTDEMTRAADRLDLGIAYHWPFLSDDEVARATARFLALGDVPHEAMDVEPTPMELDPKLGVKALKLVQDAKRWIDEGKDRQKEREWMRTLQLEADILIALDRKPEAMAALQQGLDKYPESDEYDDVEEKLKELLE